VDKEVCVELGLLVVLVKLGYAVQFELAPFC